MEYGSSKVGAILQFLNDNGVRPKAKRTRKKGVMNERQDVFYQITRLDFAVDYETQIELVKILSERVGYTHFFSGIHKDYFYRVIHDNKRTSRDKREHRFKELKLFNTGFELAIYDKKVEIAEQATGDKLKLYPPVYREILIDPQRKLFRVELRLFRSRSIAFNHLRADELFDLPAKELNKFGKATQLLKRKNKKIVPSALFYQLFAI